MTSNNWVTSREENNKIWSSGYTAAELLNKNASSSNPNGQLIDIFTTNTAANWAVSREYPVIEIPRSSKLFSNVWCGSVIAYDDQNTSSNVLEEVETDTGESVVSIDEKLNHIRSSLDISISILAKILHTSRPSVYAWLNGDIPRDFTMFRIQSIYQIAQYWDNINHYHFGPGSLLRQPIGNTASIIELLSEENLNEDEIKSGLSVVMGIMDRKRQKMDQSINRTQISQKSPSEKAKNRRFLTRTLGSND